MTESGAMDDAGRIETEEQSQPGGTKGRAARTRAALLDTHKRFRSNLVSGHYFLEARRARLGGNRPRLHWVRYAFVSVMLVTLAAVVLDLPVGNYRGDWPPEIIRYAADVTNIGKAGWILVPTGVAILIAYGLDWRVWGTRGRIFILKWLSAIGYIFFSIAAGGLITDLVKLCVGRARPEHFQELGAFSFHPFAGSNFASFPSGHATTVGGLFAALALLFPRLRLPFLILALWIAATRILVGAHFPSDVIAGLAWGTWFSYFSAMLFARYGLIFTYDATGWPVRRRGYRLLRLRRLRRLASRRRARLD